MAMLTKEQEQAINHNAGDILVSASAGSGKTHVMISRIVRLIIEKKTSVDRILATTFTEAAALEMKEKLKKALIEKVTETGDKDLAKQIPLVNTADVSTIHSFCSSLARAYFFSVGIAPDFKILSDGDDKEYVTYALNKTFTEFYESKDKDFLLLVDRLSSRNDRKLREEVLRAYYFCSEETDFDDILDRSVDNFSEKNYMALYDETVKTLTLELNKLLDEMTELQDEILARGDMPKLLKPLEELIGFISEVITTENLFLLKDCKNYKLGSRGEKSGDGQAEIRAEVARVMAKTIALMQAFIVPCDDIDEYAREREILRTHTLAFANLVKRFRDNYIKIKKEENVADFSDLQHYALTILRDESICREISEKYDFIFVDEYQDVNAIQEEIICRLDRDNVFMVGDDKQSIYSFRGCRSEFFTSKLARYKGEGRTTVRLNDNFRSSVAVVDAVNRVFDYCMTKDAYGLDYKADARLIFGGLFPNEYKGRFNVFRAENTRTKQSEDGGLETPRIYDILKELSVEQSEDERVSVSMVTDIIERELKSTCYDVKQKMERPVEFKDIVILVGKFTGVQVQSLIKGLIRRGIPLITKEEENVTEYPEVAVLMNILSALNCMLDDIPLANTLKSAYGGFTDEDLLSICRFSYPALEIKEENGNKKQVNFWQAYTYYLENADGELADRLKAFNDRFTEFRNLADFLPANEVLQRVISDSDYYANIYATPYSEAKIRRVKAFVDYANVVGTDISVRAFLEKVRSNGGKITLPTSENANAVRIMTMHKSKGLEFPVVIAFALESEFSAKDEGGEFLYNRTFGLVPKFYNDGAREIKDNLLRLKTKITIRNEKIKEQMRLFYVAMTRATYSLNLVYSGKPNEQDIFESAKSFSDFIPPSMEEVFYTTENAPMGIVKAETRKVVIGKADGDAVKKIEKALGYKYPFIKDTRLPLKSSISSAMRGEEEYYRPVQIFTEEEHGESAENGTVAHKILEYFDFASPEPVANQAQKLVESGVISKEQVEKLDLEKIALAIEKFKPFVTNKTLYREKQFISGVPARMLFGDDNESEVLAQGIIDLLAIDEASATIIDYKYSAKSAVVLKERYGRQIALYAYAVEKALGIPVKERKIVSLLTGAVIDV